MEISCRCGCGERFTPSKATAFRIKRGDSVGYLPGHAHKGSRNPRWIGGRYLNGGGYYLVRAPKGHPNARKNGYILEHRLIASKLLNRPLSFGEVVHHINEVKSDNAPENLEVTSNCNHKRLHFTGDRNPKFIVKEPKRCERCHKPFIANHGNYKRNRYCSRKCTNAFGEQALNAKLSDAQIFAIRQLAGIKSHRAIAAMFGISKTHAGRILRGESR